MKLTIRDLATRYKYFWVTFWVTRLWLYFRRIWICIILYKSDVSVNLSWRANLFDYLSFGNHLIICHSISFNFVFNWWPSPGCWLSVYLPIFRVSVDTYGFQLVCFQASGVLAWSVLNFILINHIINQAVGSMV